MDNKWVVGCDPYKKIRWWHYVLKFFGKKIKIGTMGVFKWNDDKTAITFVEQKDMYL